MKKLLLITKLFIVVIALASCQSNSKTITKSETKPKPTTSAQNTDTTKHSVQTSGAGTSGTTSGTKKDTTKQGGNAINHSSPNQAQLDSIKAVKTKDKNKKDH